MKNQIFAIGIGAVALSCPTLSVACGGGQDYPMTQCVQAGETGSTGWYLYNNCNVKIEATWCTTGPGSSGCNGSGWDQYHSSSSIQPGGRIRVYDSGNHIYYNACRFNFWD